MPLLLIFLLTITIIFSFSFITSSFIYLSDIDTVIFYLRNLFPFSHYIVLGLDNHIPHMASIHFELLRYYSLFVEPVGNQLVEYIGRFDANSYTAPLITYGLIRHL